MDSLENLSTEEVESDQYTLTRVEELDTSVNNASVFHRLTDWVVMDSLKNLSTENVENDQYTLTRVEEIEVAAAILVVFLVILYSFFNIIDVFLVKFYQFLERIVIFSLTISTYFVLQFHSLRTRTSQEELLNNNSNKLASLKSTLSLKLRPTDRVINSQG